MVLTRKGMPFVWNGKENSMLDYVYRNLKALCQRTNCDTSDEMIQSLWVKMYTSLRDCYPWLYNHCTPSMIACKFNETIANIKKRPIEQQTTINFEIINEMLKK